MQIMGNPLRFLSLSLSLKKKKGKKRYVGACSSRRRVRALNNISTVCFVPFSSVQFKMVSMRSEKPICAPHCLSEVSPTLPLKNVRLIDDGPLSSFGGRSSSASSFHASLLQAIDGVMTLASCPQTTSQAP